MKFCNLVLHLFKNGEKLFLIPTVLKMINRVEMENVPYTSIIGSLMYVQVCTCPNIAFVISVLGRYLSKLGMGTKEKFLTYKRSNNFELIGYSNSDYGGFPYDHKSISRYILCWQEELSWKISSCGEHLKAFNHNCDNSVVACFSRNNKNSKYSKHFDTKYMFVREKFRQMLRSF
ncbi:hypothetical protein CR513_23240, partial [Mucuna pruriens]